MVLSMAVKSQRILYVNFPDGKSVMASLTHINFVYLQTIV